MIVLDYIAQLNITKLLQHEKTSKIVEQLWRGNYDPKNENKSFLTSVQTTGIGVQFREHHLTLDKFLSIISIHNPGAWFYYWVSFGVSLFKRLKKTHKVTDETLFSKQKLEKSAAYSYILFKNALREQYVSDLVLLIMLMVLYIIYTVLMVKNKADLDNKYSEIKVLQSMTQTSSVLSQIEAKYDDLQGIGDDWWYYFKGLVFMSLSLLNLLFQDILILISFAARNITYKALRKSFLYRTLLDLVASILAVIVFVKYVSDYRHDNDKYRVEEQKYRTMLDTESGGFNTNVVFSFLVVFLMLKIFMQLIYNRSYGTLVQICFRMVEDASKFLVIFFTLIIAFAVVGNCLFYDLEPYGEFFESIKTLYESALGNFDFSVFNDAQKINPIYGKLYMVVYLLLSAILLLNFLIAILSDTYANYIGNGDALKHREIINLRLIFEPHPHYHCLVKAPGLLLSWFILLLSPFILKCKSQRLNVILLNIEFTPLMFVVVLFVAIEILVLTPLFYITIVILKIKLLPTHTKGVFDSIVRIIDVILFIVFTILSLPIVICVAALNAIDGLYTMDYVTLSESKKKQFIYINSLIETNSHINHLEVDQKVVRQKYFLFKRFLDDREDHGAYYDPSDYMISEIIAFVLIGTMKLLRARVMSNDKVHNNIHDYSTAVYIPVHYLITELSKNMKIQQSTQSMLYGITFSPDYDFESAEFEELIEALADESLGGINLPDIEDVSEEIIKTRNSFSVVMATLKSHKQRKQFWRNKLMMLLKMSEKQWLLDQFQYCKLFMIEN